jgi:hypothetical protein
VQHCQGINEAAQAVLDINILGTVHRYESICLALYYSDFQALAIARSPVDSDR